MIVLEYDDTIFTADEDENGNSVWKHVIFDDGLWVISIWETDKWGYFMFSIKKDRETLVSGSAENFSNAKQLAITEYNNIAYEENHTKECYENGIDMDYHNYIWGNIG